MERRLGRGLGSLLSQSDALETKKDASQVPIERVYPNPSQPRKHFEPAALSELAASLKQHGFLQPIVVRASAQGFEIISGERRWRAAQLAGLTEVPILVRDRVSDSEMLELALVENVQREDLNAMERAQGFQRLVEMLGLTQEAVAQKVGLQRSTVTNHLRLLELPTPVQDAVRTGLLSMGHARALVGIPDASAAIALMQRAVRKNLSVRQLEQLARALPKTPQRVARVAATTASAPWVNAMEERLRERLGTKVEIKNGAGYRGSITVHYFGRDDLDRVCELLAPQDSL